MWAQHIGVHVEEQTVQPKKQLDRDNVGLAQRPTKWAKMSEAHMHMKEEAPRSRLRSSGLPAKEDHPGPSPTRLDDQTHHSKTNIISLDIVI